MKPLVLILSVFILCSWKSKPKTTIIKGFDRKSWIQDSMGCLGLRWKLKLCDSLYCNKEKLIGLQEKELVCYLGNPSRSYNALDRKNERGLEYYIEGGDQCLEGYDKNDNINLDVKTLCFFIRNGIVYEVAVASGGAKCK